MSVDNSAYNFWCQILALNKQKICQNMHFYQSYPIKVPIFRVPKKKPTKILYTQETVNPKIWTPKKYHEHGYRKCLWVSLLAPSLEVKYIINQLTRLTIMANCLIIYLSLGHSSFIRFTPRNSHFLLFHMPLIMINRLFRLPQTKSRVYPNRSFWTPMARLHWFPAIRVLITWL